MTVFAHKYFRDREDAVLLFLRDGQEHAIEAVRVLEEDDIVMPGGRTVTASPMDVLARDHRGEFHHIPAHEICATEYKRAFLPIDPSTNEDADMAKMRPVLLLVEQNGDEMESIRRLCLKDEMLIAPATWQLHISDLTDLAAAELEAQNGLKTAPKPHMTS